MHKHQLQLFLFALFITNTYAEIKINSFDANANIGPLGNYSTVYAYHIELWANITGCLAPAQPCGCEVTTNVTGDDTRALIFLPTPDIARVTIDNLQPNTMYSFLLKCLETTDAKTFNVRTDYTHPSAPQNIAYSSNSGSVNITWSPPLSPTESISNYKLIVDSKVISDNISASDSSYEIKDLTTGASHTASVQACYKNKQNLILCSKQNEGQLTFELPVTTTTATIITTTTLPTTTATAKSTAVHAHYLTVSMMIFSLFLFSHMKW